MQRNDLILSISHYAEFFPVVLQNKSILDKFAKEEIRMLKKEGLIEVIDEVVDKPYVDKVKTVNVNLVDTKNIKTRFRLKQCQR